MNNGWIRIHRSIMDHWIFEDDKKLRWWLTILLRVNYQDRKVVIGNKLYECNRGESIRSLRSWAKELNTTPETIRHFFSLLQKDNMITFKSIGISTHLKVCNYDIYQSDLDSYKTITDTDKHTVGGRTSATNNTDNKEKKIRRMSEFVTPCLEDVILYFNQNGYSKELAEKAYKYYHEGGWKDGNAKQVKNWKQKMIAVWFKEENKGSGQPMPSFGKKDFDINKIR